MIGQATEALAQEITNALCIVIDPELGYNIVDLGLVYEVAVEDGGVARITMTTTTRGCPATDYLREGARDSAAGVPGVETVDVVLTYDPPWSPRMMSADAARHLGIDGDGW
jgi:metal-sulfur cluster biosynthetic enzyme